MLTRVEESIGLLYLLISPIVLGPFLSSILTPNINDDTINGYCIQGYERIYEAFKRNFGEGLEREGAALSVYHKGRKVVDVWGGYADKESNRKWKEDTTAVLFSATKAVSALCIAVLVDRGMISYNDKIIEFWPEYGKNGKENTTIEHVLTHMAGVPYLDEHIDIDDIKDYMKMKRKIENTKPLWKPGTSSGYHAMTFGFILDIIVRSVDDKGRDLKRFFKEEIALPHELSVDIGVDLNDFHRIARVTQPGILEYLRDIIKNPKIIPMLMIMYARFDDIIWRIRNNPNWIPINYDTVSLNDPDIVSLSLPAVSGVATAASLAKLFSLSIDGTLLSNITVNSLRIPTLNSWHYEQVTVWPVMKGRGFFYERNPIIEGGYTYGHPGYGGQFVHVDIDNSLTIAYVANGLKTGSGELCGPYMRLLQSAYNSIL